MEAGRVICFFRGGSVLFPVSCWMLRDAQVLFRDHPSLNQIHSVWSLPERDPCALIERMLGGHVHNQSFSPQKVWLQEVLRSLV